MKIGRVKAFGEPAVDWSEDITGVGTATLLSKQAGEADGGAQLVSVRALFAGDRASLQATAEQLKEPPSRPDVLLTELSQLAEVVHRP